MTGREQLASDSAATTQGNPSAFPTAAQGIPNAFTTAQGSSNAFPVAQGNVTVPPASEDHPQAVDEVDPQPNETAGGGQGIHVVNDMKMVFDAWSHSDFMCKKYILNCLSDPFYKVYCVVGTAKELLEKLQKKYNAQDAGTKKFIVGKFLKFQMVDSKTVMSQVHEFQMIIHHLNLEGMKPNE
ncbi:hypothetical protein K7X08_004825 [Anisodus acutangulus]|uniref:Uncharacterized protein n=1 Tax=Anisodus acutangulus TaxID=402998 RepID=A0A9Q1RII3_9SOLA|nr:hypothetical protein K7X08_004825 [Anisodus acutangulus]